MGPFVLVRHATPLRDNSVSPEEWKLDPEYIGAVSKLATLLEGAGLVQVLTSSERKAVQTGTELARLAGLLVRSDARLNEVRRPFVEDDSDFAENVKSYLRGDTLVGWEQQAVVNQRMERVVEDALEIGFAALVTHGTAMTLFLHHLCLVEPWDFWQALTTPDCWRIDGSDIRRVAGGGVSSDRLGQR
jgi:broad specificity phosphatase PhoE